MSLRFNYDNDRMLIANWPPGAGGEFLIRCLSISKHMVLISDPSEITKQINNPSDYDLKVNIFRSQHSNEKPSGRGFSHWHKHFIGSNQWLSMFDTNNNDTRKDGQVNERIFVDSHLASHEFYDRFWLPISCDVSNAGLGFGLKTHCLDEVIGLQNLLPNAKLMVAYNSDIWQNKRGNLQDAIGYAIENYGSLLGSMPHTLGHVRLNVDDLMYSESSFITQMESAYRILRLDDFRNCRDHVRELRKIYLSWHVKND